MRTPTTCADRRIETDAAGAGDSGSFAGAGLRIARVEVDGRTVWVKDFSRVSAPKWHGLQKAAFLLTRLEMVQPVPSPGGLQGLDHEVEAIRRFREIGARVPEILWIRGAVLAMSDIGETIRDIRHRDGEAAIERPAIAAARELGRIHASGLVHGRPILRNLTWDGRTPGFMDFEEQPLAVMRSDAARARDIVLLLMSLGRRCRPGVLEEALDAYETPPGVRSELRRAAGAARPLTGRFGRILLKAVRLDSSGLLQTLAALDRQLRQR